MASADLRTCSNELCIILDTEEFGPKDYWEGYKLYCSAYYSKCDTSKGRFAMSKMGRVMLQFQGTDDISWGGRFDEAIRDAWAEMEDYVQNRHGKDCRNLRALMEEFEDVDNFKSSEDGCLLLQVIQDDERQTQRTYTRSRNTEVNIDIFEQIRDRLHQVEANLASLSPKSRSTKRRKL